MATTPPQQIDYEGFDPDAVPKPLFQPGVYSTLFHMERNIQQQQQQDNTPTPLPQQEFIAHPVPHPTWGRTFGGVCLGQSLSAAYHSLTPTQQRTMCLSNHQAYWLRTGDDKADMTYQVTQLKASKAYLNVQVHTFQHNQLIFTALCTFVHLFENNSHHHSFPALPIDFKTLPPPADLDLMGSQYLSLSEVFAKQGDMVQSNGVKHTLTTAPYLIKPISRTENTPSYWMSTKEEPMITAQTLARVPHAIFGNNVPQYTIQKPITLPRSLMYVKLPQTVYAMFGIPPPSPEQVEKEKQRLAATPLNYQPQPKADTHSLEQFLNTLALLYVSDFMMIGQTVKPHQSITGLPYQIQFSSLNHNFNLITPYFDLFNDWLIFDSSAPYVSSSRGQLVGVYYRRDGVPVAYITQQTVMRVHSPEVASKFPNPYTQGVVAKL